MTNIPEIFGSLVFNDTEMKKRLPEETYHALKRTMEFGRSLDISIANEIAEAMKDWAIENDATHYTHWFQPMTGITAEKHDSFIQPADEGKIIMKFSGKELIKGESDASSFPSGGLRATFEARGYTAWDATSYAFIKDRTLCIPTAYCSFGAEALDKKTPLLRSMEAINREATRILRLFGHDEKVRVTTTVGAEQEYFLIDKNLYNQRKDLIYTGRTLFGAMPPKGQELDDHYFGAIKPRISAFMQELDIELWKLGILSKTRHNEAAPSQHELAPVFASANTATDHNQLTMEIMKKIAGRHGLACLLHEKPFEGVNGSGKHDNWSICTSSGINLLEPGDSPYDNAQFLIFLVAVIKAVDEYQSLLRVCIASASNDHRLGADEAPPAIVSIFLGDELTEILDSIENDTAYSSKESERLRIGVHTLPKFPKDTTDRNRTSPFAFTGNKFEFRMVGSMSSVAGPNTVLNSIVADELSKFADALENTPSEKFEEALHELIKTEYRNHKRIIFNGNGYTDEWIKEAESRGLKNYPTTPDCLPHFLDDNIVEMYERMRVFSKTEMVARDEIHVEAYCKAINIEALTMVDMARKEIIPTALKFAQSLSELVLNKAKINSLSGVNIDSSSETALLNSVTALTNEICAACDRLEELTFKAKELSFRDRMCFYRDEVIPAMNALRTPADKLEMITPRKLWPYPTYGDMLYSV